MIYCKNTVDVASLNFYEKMIKQLILLTFFIFPIKLMLKIS